MFKDMENMINYCKEVQSKRSDEKYTLGCSFCKFHLLCEVFHEMPYKMDLKLLGRLYQEDKENACEGDIRVNKMTDKELVIDLVKQIVKLQMKEAKIKDILTSINVEYGTLNALNEIAKVVGE